MLRLVFCFCSFVFLFMFYSLRSTPGCVSYFDEAMPMSRLVLWFSTCVCSLGPPREQLFGGWYRGRHRAAADSRRGAAPAGGVQLRREMAHAGGQIGPSLL